MKIRLPAQKVFDAANKTMREIVELRDKAKLAVILAYQTTKWWRKGEWRIRTDAEAAAVARRTIDYRTAGSLFWQQYEAAERLSHAAEAVLDEKQCSDLGHCVELNDQDFRYIKAFYGAKEG